MTSALSLGPHAVFIVASYAVTLAVVVGLVLWVWLDGRRQTRILAELEARGVRRRSAEPAVPAAAGHNPVMGMKRQGFNICLICFKDNKLSPVRHKRVSA